MRAVGTAALLGALLVAAGAGGGATRSGADDWEAWRAARSARFAAWRKGGQDRQATTPGTRIWECAACPEMVVAPAGDFTIGSPPDEPGRTKDEGPQRRVTIARTIAVGKFEVTRGEYETFLRATGHPIGRDCVTDRAHQGTFAPEPHTTLRDPGFAQTDDHPVVCVSWDDAQAYIAWLNAGSRGGYRLLSEAEFEYLARAGSTTTYPWGPSADAGCADANVVDATARRKYPDWPGTACDDGALNTARVGSYRPNAFGLYDMIGNVEEWVEDCATDSYAELPADGAPTRAGDCTRHIVRSGSWGAVPNDCRVANRIRYPTGQLDDSIGFRVARTVR